MTLCPVEERRLYGTKEVKITIQCALHEQKKKQKTEMKMRRKIFNMGDVRGR